LINILKGDFTVVISKRFSIGQFILCFLLLIIAISMLFPFIYILCISFTDASVYKTGSLMIWPSKWSTEAYRLIFSGRGFMNSLSSTLFITLIGTPLSVVVNAGMAYMLSKKSLPGRDIMLKLVVFTLLFYPGMIPNYLVIKNLHLINSFWALILPGVAGAWTMLVMKSFFQGIPSELEESATIDGSNEIQTFFMIVLPLSKAMLAAFTLFGAVSYWNTYFSAIIYLNDADKWPLQVFLQQIVMSTNISELVDVTVTNNFENKVIPTEIVKMAAVIVAVTPILSVYPFLQKHFAKGVLIGSVKG
jgi:putative aldouronate transport system permease protein